jgi:hypothetical protein
VNKKIIIPVVILGILGIIALVVYLIPLLTPECKNTLTGWTCRWSDDNFPLVGIIQLIYEKKCEKQGGAWDVYSCANVSPIYYCDFPFDDAGKERTNSQQCKGKCIVDSEYVEKNYPNRKRGEYIICSGICKGKCSKYPLRRKHYFEVNDNVIEEYGFFLFPYCGLPREWWWKPN